MQVKSFDVAKMVIDEANERFSPIFKVIPECVAVLQNYCEAIDGILNNQTGREFEFEIDEETMEVKMAMVFEDFTVEDPMNEKFQQLAERAGTVSFENVDGETMRITLTYPPLWEKA